MTVRPATSELRAPTTEEVRAPRAARLAIEAFEDEKISYCYWRSSRRLPRAMAGESDLDLLVAAEDRHRFVEILLRHGFKLFPATPAADHPGVASFLNYDERSDVIYHIHAHFRLIVGPPLLKSHWLPWESLILERAVWGPEFGIRMLDPESEALLVVIRSCVESSWSDPIALKNRAATVRKFAEDRRALRARARREALHQLTERLLTRDLADAVTEIFFSEDSSRRDAVLREYLRKGLQPYRIYGAAEAHSRSLGRAALWGFGFLNQKFPQAPRPWRRRPLGGGCVVALVGVDGSGKSTIVRTAQVWLSREIDTMSVYFGTGDGRATLPMLAFKMMIPLARLVLRGRPRGSSHGTVRDSSPGRSYSAMMLIWASVVAWEKRVKLIRAWRGAHRGLVVLTDRYPQNEIPSFNDGPLLHRLASVPRPLSAFEEATYALANRLPPDLVIRLLVSPETVEAREPTMDPTIIRTRLDQLRRLRFGGARIVNVDAEQPLVEVVRIVKKEIWSLL